MKSRSGVVWNGVGYKVDLKGHEVLLGLIDMSIILIVMILQIYVKIHQVVYFILIYGQSLYVN